MSAAFESDPVLIRQGTQRLARCRVQHGWELHPPFFQVLVSAEVKDNQPISVSYVTHHDLQDDEPRLFLSTSAR